MFEFKKSRFFEEVNNDYDVLISHFHILDLYHHYFYPENESRIEFIYEKMNNFVKRVKNEVEFERIVLMSDHGVPTRFEHNKNAFYSCNQNLFGENMPHITDFYDSIILLTKTSDKDMLSNISI